MYSFSLSAAIILDGVAYQGADPYGPAISSPIRQVSSNSPASPVYGDINGAAMTCGGDAQPASLTAPVTAGSEISISWGLVSHSSLLSYTHANHCRQWPHNVGPIMTYLGACNGPCETTDPSTIDFFKIDEVSFEPGTHNWVQGQTVYLGLPYNFTLPEDIPTGDYIMRHEIIALRKPLPFGLRGYMLTSSFRQRDERRRSRVLPSVHPDFRGLWLWSYSPRHRKVPRRLQCDRPWSFDRCEQSVRFLALVLILRVTRFTRTRRTLCTPSPAPPWIS